MAAAIGLAGKSSRFTPHRAKRPAGRGKQQQRRAQRVENADWPRFSSNMAARPRGNAKPLARRGALMCGICAQARVNSGTVATASAAARGHPLLGHRHPAIAASQQQRRQSRPRCSHCRRLGARRRRAHAARRYNPIAGQQKRTAAIISGGQLATPMRMARWVDPKSHTARQTPPASASAQREQQINMVGLSGCAAPSASVAQT